MKLICLVCGEEIVRTKYERNDPLGISWHHFFNKKDVKNKINSIIEEPKTDIDHFRKHHLTLWIWENMPKFPMHKGCHDKYEARIKNLTQNKEKTE